MLKLNELFIANPNPYRKETQKDAIRQYLTGAFLAEYSYFQDYGEYAIRDMIIKMGASRVEFVHKKAKIQGDKIDAQCLVIIFQGVAIVSIAGTNQSSDWITNIDIHKEDTAWGQSHNGFLHYWGAIKNEVLTAIGPGISDVFIIGHSLGAAGASQGAADITFDDSMGLKVVGLLTYGEPLSFDSIGAKMVAKELYPVSNRYVFCCDIVTRIPPEQFGFKHMVQDAWYISSHGKFLKTEEGAKWSRVWGRINGALHFRWLTKWGGSRSAGIAHHYLDTSYIPKVISKYGIKDANENWVPRIKNK